jgi:hypothetical protein
LTNKVSASQPRFKGRVPKKNEQLTKCPQSGKKLGLFSTRKRLECLALKERRGSGDEVVIHHAKSVERPR